MRSFKKSFITLLGIFLRFVYTGDSFCIFLLKPFRERKKIKVVYHSDPEPFFKPGIRLLLTGTKENNNRYGEQFTAYVVKQLPDHFGEGFVEFLTRRIKGIGEVTAQKLTIAFGEELKKVLDKFYRYESELKKLGITREQLRSIVESWEKCRREAEVLPYLCSFGLTANQAEQVLSSLGAGVIEKIKKDPYILTHVKGLGFIRADKIAHKIGKVDERQRLEAAVLYTLKEASIKEGHCFLTFFQLKEKLKQFTGIEIKDEDKLLKTIERSTRIISVMNNNAKVERIYLNRLYESTDNVTKKLLEKAYTVSPLKLLKKELENFLSKNSFLTDKQKIAILNALTESSVSYITGLPGTGKTTAVKELVAFLRKKEIPFLLLAPTGKAAKRLEEQVEEKTSTIHRALRFKLKSKKEIITKFKETETLPEDLSVFLCPEYHQENPLPEKVIVVDEASMIDVFVFELLLNALKKNSLLILIGDPDQLPPVGPGQILKDIVISKDIFRGTVLTDTIRQSKDSGIVNLAHLVHKGRIPRYFFRTGSCPYNDVKFVEKDDKNYQGIIDEIIKAVEENEDKENLQVLSCMHKGKLGTKSLNEILRPLFISVTNINDNNNDDKEKIKIGERIIQIENNYDKMVFNGETGKIVKINGKKYTVEFDDKIVDYTYKELINQTEPAYCLTVHKTQGSEYNTVIMPLTTSHYILLTRNLLYTAITRAKKKLYLIGSQKAFAIAVKNSSQQRNSCVF